MDTFSFDSTITTFVLNKSRSILMTLFTVTVTNQLSCDNELCKGTREVMCISYCDYRRFTHHTQFCKTYCYAI